MLKGSVLFELVLAQLDPEQLWSAAIKLGWSAKPADLAIVRSLQQSRRGVSDEEPGGTCREHNIWTMNHDSTASVLPCMTLHCLFAAGR